jgi:hypothetical protein
MQMDVDARQGSRHWTVLLGALRVLFEGSRREIRDPCLRFEIDPANGPFALPLFEMNFAVVWMRWTGKPAFVSSSTNSIEKHPAWAAPSNSSGLAPLPSPMRERKL